MPALQSVGKMQLEDACDETPQAEQLLELCRQDVEEVRTFGTMFHASCSKTAEGFAAMVSGLTEMLEVSKQIHTRFSREDESNVSFLQAQNGLQTMIVYLGEVCGIMHNMSNELSNNMMYPIDRFMRADLEALEHRSAVHCASSEQYKETLDKYARLPKRKTDARTRAERYDEVHVTRVQAREDTLHYFAALHSLNLKRSYLFLEPLLGYLRAFVAATRSSTDAMTKRDIETNLAVFDAFVKSEHRDLTADQRRLETQIETMRNQLRAEAFSGRLSDGEAKRKPDEPPSVADDDSAKRKESAGSASGAGAGAGAGREDEPAAGRVLRSQQSLQKSGYLFVKRAALGESTSAKSGVASFLSGSARHPAGNWERAFVFIQGGNLMVQARQELAGSSLVDLQDANVLVRAEHAELDDRFGVFAVSYTSLPGASGAERLTAQSASQVENGKAAAASGTKAEKKTVAYFQTESEMDRDEWIRLINLNAGVSTDSLSAATSAAGTPRSHSVARSASTAPNESPSHAAQRTANVTQQLSVDASLMRARDSPNRSPNAAPPLDLDTALEFVPIQFDFTDAPTPADGDQPASLGVAPPEAAVAEANCALVDAILNALASPSYVRTNPFNADTSSTATQSLADEIAAVESEHADASESEAAAQTSRTSAVTAGAGQSTVAPRFVKRFLVRFVGSMHVGGAAQHTTGGRDELVSAAIRKMLAARSTHDLMHMLELSFVLCEHCIVLLDGANRQSVRALIDLQRVVQLMCHRENSRYFGFLARKHAPVVGGDNEEHQQLECFAFECDTGATDVYEAFKLASRIAFQASLSATAKAPVASPPSST